MRIFLSWSKPTSRSVSSFFKNWLPQTIQECREIFTSTEISKGDAWFQSITEAAENSSLGLVFITAENQAETWLNFEAGALYSQLTKKRMCPILVDLDETEYSGPLQYIQFTKLSDKEDIWKLLITINTAADNPLPEPILEQAFAANWPRLEEFITKLKAETTPTLGVEQERSTDDKVDEILTGVRELQRRSSVDVSDVLERIRKNRSRELRDSDIPFEYKAKDLSGRLSADMAYRRTMRKFDEEMERLLGGSYAYYNGNLYGQIVKISRDLQIVEILTTQGDSEIRHVSDFQIESDIA